LAAGLSVEESRWITDEQGGPIGFAMRIDKHQIDRKREALLGDRFDQNLAICSAAVICAILAVYHRGHCG